MELGASCELPVFSVAFFPITLPCLNPQLWDLSLSSDPCEIHLHTGDTSIPLGSFSITNCHGTTITIHEHLSCLHPILANSATTSWGIFFPYHTGWSAGIECRSLSDTFFNDAQLTRRKTTQKPSISSRVLLDHTARVLEKGPVIHGL